MDGSAPSASDQGVLALEDWKQPPRHQPGPAAAPVLAVDGFEGPLDWLLDLARTRRIDLARLSIVALVEAFAEALGAALATPDLRPTLLGLAGGEARVDGCGCTGATAGAASAPVHRGSPARGAAIYEGAAANDGSGGSAGTIAPANGLGVRRHGGLGNQTWAEGDMKSPGNIPS